MTTVLITGGTGLIGSKLSSMLLSKGYEVAVLGRSAKPKAGIRSYSWNPEKKEIDPAAIARADYIIHLAGEKIGDKRWSAERKKQIVESRTQSAALIFASVKKAGTKIKAFISASAIGYYGMLTSNKIFEEADAPGNDFLANACVEWEKAADKFLELGIRTVKVRTGIVLSPEGGALPKMLAPVKLGLAAPIGSGKQYMPWIHIDDLCGIYLKAIEDAGMHGSYNAVAPQHITNEAFMKTAAQVLEKPFVAPRVPSFVLKLMFGEMADMLLTGSRVSAKKILAAGFQVKFPKLKEAIKEF